MDWLLQSHWTKATFLERRLESYYSERGREERTDSSFHEFSYEEEQRNETDLRAKSEQGKDLEWVGG